MCIVYVHVHANYWQTCGGGECCPFFWHKKYLRKISWSISLKNNDTTISIAINLRWKVFHMSADLWTLMRYRALSELSRRRRHQAREHSDSDEL